MAPSLIIGCILVGFLDPILKERLPGKKRLSGFYWIK
jgi:hypothetical protein